MNPCRKILVCLGLLLGSFWVEPLQSKEAKWPQGGDLEVSLEVRKSSFDPAKKPKEYAQLLGYLIIKNTGSVAVPVGSYMNPSHLVVVAYTRDGEHYAGEIDGGTRLEMVDSILQPGETLKWRMHGLGFINGEGQLNYMSEDGERSVWFFAVYRPVGRAGPEYVSPVTMARETDTP